MVKFKASIPRRMYWSENLGQRGVCPECGARLEQEMHSFLAVMKTKCGTDEFIIGNHGYFCSDCPLVVLVRGSFAELLSVAVTPTAFTLKGIVDLDAVPHDRAHLPLGDDDNPIPLIEFTNLSKTKKNYGEHHNQHRRIGRNEPCPCGSGKKYKKCCLLKERGIAG